MWPVRSGPDCSAPAPTCRPRFGACYPGLIDGDTTHLDPAVATAFRTTGMTHLLAVSGSNVAMIIGCVLLMCRWSRAGPTMSAIVCGIALVGFVILVRPTPSVLRAAAMGCIGLVALATGRVRAAVPALATTVTVLIVYDPALATDIGFGLSTFATAGLLLIAPHWRDALLRRRVPRGAAEALAVPAAAQVACSPLIAGFSGTVSIIAVPANLVAIPAVPAATILGVAAAVISPLWPSGAAFLAWLASWPARWLLARRGAWRGRPGCRRGLAQRCMGCAGSGRDPGCGHRRRPAPTGSHHRRR